MSNDWKQNLTVFFNENKVYRIKRLNDDLESFCKEYLSFINEFYGVGSRIEHGDSLDGEVYKINMYIGFNSWAGKLQPYKTFRITLYYNQDGNLILKHSVDFRWDEKHSDSVKHGVDDKKDYYTYKEEEIDDLLRHEKEFIFQLITNRLTNYIALQKKKENK